MTDHHILIVITIIAPIFGATYILFRLWLLRQARRGFEYQRKDRTAD